MISNSLFCKNLNSKVILALPNLFHLNQILLLFARPSLADIQIVEMVDFDNVTFSKSVYFSENNTLLEDIRLLDSTFEEEMMHSEQRKLLQKSLDAKPKRMIDPLLLEPRESRRHENSQLELRVLLVADHSMYDMFQRLHGNDEYAAFHSLNDYLNGIFDQLTTIFNRLFFYNTLQIKLRLAGAMTIFRAEDCPLRSPVLFHELTLNYDENLNNNVSAIGVDDEQMIYNVTTNNDFNDTTIFPTLLPPKMLTFEDLVKLRSWQSVEGLMAVHRIHNWAEKHADILPSHDHVVVITKLDLLSQNNDSATQGMAYVRAMCRGPDSASVVEDVGGLSTATVVAHEMAHSLGAFHDGSGANENCSSRYNFLMSPTSSSAHEFSEAFSNAFLLSECSINQIEDFLNSSESDCLWKQPKREQRDLNTRKFSKIKSEAQSHQEFDDQKHFGMTSSGIELEPLKKPGEQFNANKQCKIAFGEHYGLCRRQDFYLRMIDPCRRLWCKNRKRKRSAACETKAFLPLMDGTRCGPSKWCISGICTINQRASKWDRQDRCVNINEAYCNGIPTKMRRSFCSAKAFAKVCCATCKSLQLQKESKGNKKFIDMEVVESTHIHFDELAGKKKKLTKVDQKGDFKRILIGDDDL